MTTFFKVLSSIQSFDLASIFRSIAFPFVFIFVCYSELIDSLTAIEFSFEVFTPQPIVNPFYITAEELQHETVKNLRKLDRFSSKIRKQQMIDQLLTIA